MLQFGPKGMVLTVERHCVVLIAGIAAASLFTYRGQYAHAKAAIGITVGFFAAVRAVIWMVMNIKI